MKIFRIFHMKTFIFLIVKFSVYLNRRVLVMYPSMIRPLLEYCSAVRNPHTRQYIQMTEMVQYRTAWFVTNRYHHNSGVTTMLDHLTLEARLTKKQCVMFIKIIHGLIEFPAEKYLMPASKHGQVTLFNSGRDYHKYSFFQNTVCLWIPSQPVWLMLPVWYWS